MHEEHCSSIEVPTEKEEIVRNLVNFVLPGYPFEDVWAQPPTTPTADAVIEPADADGA